MFIIDQLHNENLISPPKWLAKNTVYLTITGSHSYGVSTDKSDLDFYGICVPPKEIIFPHLNGIVPGFGTQGEKFESWCEQHIKHENLEYDFTVFNIVKAFQLIMDGNPNQIEQLFSSDGDVIRSTPVGNLIRENRKLFLSKNCFYKFIGFASGQIKRLRSGSKSVNPKIIDLINRFGYNIKEAYHIPRLLNQVEQILLDGDLDLCKNNEMLISVRNGEWTLDQIEKYYNHKVNVLQSLLSDAVVPDKPNEKSLRELLINCLELHYGNLGLFKTVK
jgi:predicted nucleotidyltransferase